MLIKVKTVPDSKKNKLVKTGGDSYEAYVREKAEHGMANRRLREMLTHHFSVPPGSVKLLKGGKRRNKIFEIVC